MNFVYFMNYLILNLFIIIIKSSIVVEEIFNSIDEHNLLCDDFLNFYGTSNLNVYKISENGITINVNSQLRRTQYKVSNPNYFCSKHIYYSTNSNNEKLLIELNNAQNLYGLFRNSTAVYIEIKSGNFEEYDNYIIMFGLCQNLISIDLSNFSFKKAIKIYSFFHSCSNLEEIIWPTNKENSLIEVPAHMFTGCSKLTSIDLSFFDFSKVSLMHTFF